jgi:hypothetical protein
MSKALIHLKNAISSGKSCKAWRLARMIKADEADEAGEARERQSARTSPSEEAKGEHEKFRVCRGRKKTPTTVES